MKRNWIAFAVVVVSVAAGIGVAQGPRSASADGVVSLALGNHHTCALTLAGAVKCWGDNSLGQLGDGTAIDSNIPRDVVGLQSGVTAISAQHFHTCALLSTGGVKCWGLNSLGQLGDGTSTPLSHNTPVDVCASGSGPGCGGGGALYGAIGIAAGTAYSCALLSSSEVYCWGYNSLGQLGDGTLTGPRLNPVAVCATGAGAGCSGGAALTGVWAISAGNAHACALTTPGGTVCWGSNGAGQLGDGQSCGGVCANPASVSGAASDADNVNAGDRHTCATIGGSMQCWGGNESGQLGDGTVTSSSVPVDVCDPFFFCPGPFALFGAESIEAAAGYSCVIISSTGNSAMCWGQNAAGQLGDGATAPKYYPTDVCITGTGMACVPANGIATIAGWNQHTCLARPGGAVQCWGNNDDGQLGDATTTSSLNPTMAFGLGLQPDSDGDGCPNLDEVQTGPGSELSGGMRDPKNPWDYFNPSGDGQNRVDDILATVNAYFSDDSDANPGLPPYEPGYNPATDRDNDAASPNAWNTGAPDGLQRIQDVVHAVNSYFHDCS